MYVLMLPDELLSFIGTLLPPISLTHTAQVNQRFKKVFSDPLVWKNIFDTRKIYAPTTNPENSDDPNAYRRACLDLYFSLPPKHREFIEANISGNKAVLEEYFSYLTRVNDDGIWLKPYLRDRALIIATVNGDLETLATYFEFAKTQKINTVKEFLRLSLISYSQHSENRQDVLDFFWKEYQEFKELPYDKMLANAIAHHSYPLNTVRDCHFTKSSPNYANVAFAMSDEFYKMSHYDLDDIGFTVKRVPLTGVCMAAALNQIEYFQDEENKNTPAKYFCEISPLDWAKFFGHEQCAEKLTNSIWSKSISFKKLRKAAFVNAIKNQCTDAVKFILSELKKPEKVTRIKMNLDLEKIEFDIPLVTLAGIYGNLECVNSLLVFNSEFSTITYESYNNREYEERYTTNKSYLVETAVSQSVTPLVYRLSVNNNNTNAIQYHISPLEKALKNSFADEVIGLLANYNTNITQRIFEKAQEAEEQDACATILFMAKSLKYINSHFDRFSNTLVVQTTFFSKIKVNIDINATMLGTTNEKWFHKEIFVSLLKDITSDYSPWPWVGVKLKHFLLSNREIVALINNSDSSFEETFIPS